MSDTMRYDFKEEVLKKNENSKNGCCTKFNFEIYKTLI